jgi:RND family efflux transporter MFP subunit
MVALARAKVSSAQSMLEEARLRLARTEVRSASDGIVLERRVMPGSSVGDADAVVCTLYDPRSIRVRVDIPQGEVGKVGVGMRAEILAESRPGRPYSGEVIRLVHKADIQKVTLQVHVRIEDGDALIRPEMLIQARFIASADAAPTASGVRESFAIPARLVIDGGRVWVIDGSSRTARLRTVEVGPRSGDEVEIRSGLNATDKLIDVGREELVEGARVTTREP